MCFFLNKIILKIILTPNTKKNIDEEEKIRKKIEIEGEIRAEVRAERAEIEKKNKKKSPLVVGCLSLLVLAVIVYFIMFNPSTPAKKIALITPEIKQEIKDLGKIGSVASKYISITDITESDSGYISINVEFLYEPELINEVKVWTDAICKDTYKILKKHNIDYSIFVHARRHEGEDFIRMYGDTNYDKYSGAFRFKEAK